MAVLDGDLFGANFAQVRIVDVSDDYLLLQPPLPSDFYPVLEERWLSRYHLGEQLPAAPLIEGYLYDWHESPEDDDAPWIVAVARQGMSVPAG